MKSPFAHLNPFSARAEAPPPDGDDNTEKGDNTEPDGDENVAEPEKEPDGDEAETETEENEDGEPLAGKSPAYKAAFRAGAARERQRWAGALADKAAAGNLPLACHLLSTTPLPAAAVLGAVKAASPSPHGVAPSAGDRLALAKMDAAPQPKIGPGGKAGPLDALDAALDRLCGKKKQ